MTDEEAMRLMVGACAQQIAAHFDPAPGDPQDPTAWADQLGAEMLDKLAADYGIDARTPCA